MNEDTFAKKLRALVDKEAQELEGSFERQIVAASQATPGKATLYFAPRWLALAAGLAVFLGLGLGLWSYSDKQAAMAMEISLFTQSISLETWDDSWSENLDQVYAEAAISTALLD